MLELMHLASAGQPASVAPRDIVLVEYQGQKYRGTVRAERAGHLLVDVETPPRPILALVYPDAIVKILGRAS